MDASQHQSSDNTQTPAQVTLGNSKHGYYWLVIVFVMSICTLPRLAQAASPELSMREFSSGQIKKGVRSIGFGGDGATWGNYGPEL